mgnify:CR=1 FL=1
MYRIYVVGIDKENKSHMISTRDFEYYEDVTAIIRYALERITGAPFFCVPNRLFVKKLDDSELAGKYEFRSNSIETNVRDGCRFVDGWTQRDALTSDDESDDEPDDESDDESDDDKRGDLASKYNELASKYNELASKYNELARFPVIITGSENGNSSKRCKLFI